MEPGEVSNLKHLDQTVLELKEQLTNPGENRRDKTQLEPEDRPSMTRQSEERSHRDGSPARYNRNSNSSRWSIVKFSRFTEDDLRSWLFKIEQYFSMEMVVTEEKIEVAAMQLEREAIQ